MWAADALIQRYPKSPGKLVRAAQREVFRSRNHSLIGTAVTSEEIERS
jgi:hypothetical protein